MKFQECCVGIKDAQAAMQVIRVLLMVSHNDMPIQVDYCRLKTWPISLLFYCIFETKL